MPREDGQFGPGNVPANPPPDTTGMVYPSAMLQAYRRVFKNPASKDKDNDKALRKLMHSNPKEFFTQLERMERDLNEARAKAGLKREAVPEKDSAPERDERLEAVDELIGELLAKWGAE
jgi:hypothetical protein